MTSDPRSLTALALVVVVEQGPQVHSFLIFCASFLPLCVSCSQYSSPSCSIHGVRGSILQAHELHVVPLAGRDEWVFPEARPGHRGVEIVSLGAAHREIATSFRDPERRRRPEGSRAQSKMKKERRVGGLHGYTISPVLPAPLPTENLSILTPRTHQRSLGWG